MRAISAALAAAVVLIGMALGSAQAAQPREVAPGVYVDPNSPAAKEYALPIQQARSTGATPSAGSSSGKAPLFGAGIARTTTTPTTRPKPRPRSSRSAKQSAPVSKSAKTPPPSAPAAAGSSGGGGTLALVGGAVVILAVGGLGGVILRRRRSLEPNPD
ncbi:MAG TPA: hypothetical protein VIJ51_19380 [Solirubrobacteraceae bacterium]